MSMHKQITSEQRDELSALLKAGLDYEEIGIILNKDPSTISKEISRNSDEITGRYHARAAKIKLRQRRLAAKSAEHKIQKSQKLEKYVVVKLKKYWSPEQIAGRLKHENHNETIVGKDAIYQYVYMIKPELQKYLRFKKNQYRKRRGTKIREKQREEAKKKRINIRPEIVEQRERIGDWEGDTIISKNKKSALLTHVERKSGYLLADKMNTRTANEAKDKIIKRFKNIPRIKKLTETYDNGVEFSDHKEIERFTSIAIYFAFPYHSWERGTNENTNGLLRQFFPKSISFDTINQNTVERVVRLLNNRPRKRLSYLTPREVFLKCDSD